MSRKAVLLSSVAVAVGVAAALRSRRNGGMSLHGKVVVITGGSRGLGIALARGFAEEGCHLVLCARSAEELESASQNLAQYGSRVTTIQCDVTDRAQVEHLIAAAIQQHGRIDILVNNAGIIQVGPVETMTIEDFEKAMDVIFWGTVYTTLAALPHMREKGDGRIVNITSVGAKVSIPHLMPYSCAKFAAAAFSEGLRAELQSTGIKVVTIAPGLMRTGSHLNALFNGEGEAAWFSLGASLPAVSMNADTAASKIIAATAKGTAERILSVPANFLARFHGMFPGAMADILGLVNRALPKEGRNTHPGTESAVLRQPVLYALTTLGRWAAERYLQPGMSPSTSRAK